MQSNRIEDAELKWLEERIVVDEVDLAPQSIRESNLI